MLPDALKHFLVQLLGESNDFSFICWDEPTHLLDELFEIFRFIGQVEGDLPEPAGRCDVSSAYEKQYSGSVLREYSPLISTPTLSFVSTSFLSTAIDSVIIINDFRSASRESRLSLLATASLSRLNHPSRS
jgi:hypothetical protein